ncbi:ventral expressed homeobox [Centropristis striata]|uniref:ventral expressed homeobox n=1 Tax=Centropristis striata TaxID=184440 RepID=UPI0027DFEF1E|nr:ventral expressed homeobox [Centropristis striata]
MAHFSVEWLSKSYYEDSEVQRENEEFKKEPRCHYPPTSPNNSCCYTSGSESEVGEDSEGEAGQQRRMRTKFTSEQISKLESAFSKHRYLGAMQRRRISERLKLSETQVKTWFQNRRMKLKREVQDLRPDFRSVQDLRLDFRSVQDLRPDFRSVPAALVFQHPALSGQLPGAASGFSRQQQPLRSASLPAALLQQPRPLPVLRPPHFY